jgi:class 3 adenylate cyclase
MPVCAGCGQDNPRGFRFCGACGTPLATPGRRLGEERKVVTVLFCDLVGFTARSDQADPEDVGAMLRPFHAKLRTEIERLGGTVDKLIGDAVMGVFGAPVAHEDDPERAVRCALRILDAIDELNAATPSLLLAVRIGITTGEALIALAPGHQTETVVGDVVNTAARLQEFAPVNGAVVGESTWRATRAQFDFEALEPVKVKGKAEALAIWRIGRSRPRGRRCPAQSGGPVHRPRRGADLARAALGAGRGRALDPACHRPRRTRPWQEPARAGAVRARRRPA